MKHLISFLAVFVGALFGGGFRYLIGLAFGGGSGFPFGTLFVNLTGAFCLPLLIHYLHDRFELSDGLVLSLSSGVLGAYTTFSTFTADVFRLFSGGEFVLLGLYLILSMVGGFLLALLGNYLAAFLAHREFWGNKKAD
ncbi:fluoride efflux transporter FluC [Companilactobacillus zhongbaensis]|uniref:fluoride efflux transporter FluC n=1 Tax=Companilactobacillus zhongbaensis TaxID=2486009 RepID=UPI000F7716B5|nr:CrcB family protein [Companilactobacillus zhongbaensis]